MQAMQCPMCGLQYSSAPEDLNTHQEIHKNAAISYDIVMQKYQGLPQPIRWSGRPEIEDIGTYLALNTLNPRMIGFKTITGLDDTDLESFKGGDGEIVPVMVSGDGHDRAGLWLTSNGRAFKFTANWRAGMANFWLHTAK